MEARTAGAQRSWEAKSHKSDRESRRKRSKRGKERGRQRCRISEKRWKDSASDGKTGHQSKGESEREETGGSRAGESQEGETLGDTQSKDGQQGPG